MIKTLVHLDGRKFKLGRNRPKTHGPRLSLRNYLQRSLPSPPHSVDYSSPTKSLANIYGNDVLGDCVIAASGHILGVLTANGDGEVILTEQQIETLYGVCGYTGDPSTDDGCNIQPVLDSLQTSGYPLAPRHKIAGYLAVNPSDPIECRIALYLFENLIYGFELPDAWVNPFPSASGFTWDYAGLPDPENGHCVMACGYGPSGITINSWAMLGTITDAATKFYCDPSNGGELYTVLSIDLVKRATLRAPSGFDWTQLVADFDAIGAGKIL